MMLQKEIQKTGMFALHKSGVSFFLEAKETNPHTHTHTNLLKAQRVEFLVKLLFLPRLPDSSGCLFMRIEGWIISALSDVKYII